MDVDRLKQPHRAMPPLVLTVEDDNLLRAIYKQLFTSSGLRCIACSRADEALHVMLARLPNLIMVDYDLPGMPGPELAQVIRAVWPQIPLLLLTGRTSVEMEVRNYFDSVHFKGDEPAALVYQVRRLSTRSSGVSSSANDASLQSVQVENPNLACIPPSFASVFGQ